VQQSIDASQVEEAAMTNEVALALRYIQTAHNDPADRLIAATAAVYDLTLLTADERLLEGRGYKHVSPHS
jgi:PIN domain nuclease of toxin-antitoxin system